jgi:multiple sugar transport system permease protein
VSGSGPILGVGRRELSTRPRRLVWQGRLPVSDFAWVIAFIVPYAGMLLIFAAYPIAYGFWMAGRRSLYQELLLDPLYVQTVVTTVLFVGIGVNLKMLLALLLSGFFVRREWWIKATLVIYVLPWSLSAIPTFTSIHWMAIGPGGFLDSLSLALFGVEGPMWFNDRWLALGCNIVSYVWKWTPFWTLIFLAGRMAIPREIHEAAEVDGATGLRHFVHVTFPLLANTYLICTLLATIWALGDFATVSLVSGGAPKNSTDVLATLGIHYAFDMLRPELAVAVAMSTLPVLIPIVITLMRRLRIREVQL